MKRIAITLAVLLVTMFLFVGVTSSTPYDPWYDFDDDGDIDIYDIVDIAGRYGTLGTPINKTELLLDLQSRIEALEALMPVTGNISIPAAAFTPQHTAMDWPNYGWTMQNHEISGNATFYAGVQLPHGATVTNVTMYYTDLALDSVYCELYRLGWVGDGIGRWSMASVSSVAESGEGFNYDDSIAFATIDNDNNTYYLYVTVPAGPFAFHYAVIEYEYQ